MPMVSTTFILSSPPIKAKKKSTLKMQMPRQKNNETTPNVFLVMWTLKLSGHLSFGWPLKERKDVVGQGWRSYWQRTQNGCFFLIANNTPINWSPEPSLQKSYNSPGCVSLNHLCRKDKKTGFLNDKYLKLLHYLNVNIIFLLLWEYHTQ